MKDNKPPTRRGRRDGRRRVYLVILLYIAVFWVFGFLFVRYLATGNLPWVWT